MLGLYKYYAGRCISPVEESYNVSGKNSSSGHASSSNSTFGGDIRVASDHPGAKHATYYAVTNGKSSTAVLRLLDSTRGPQSAPALFIASGFLNWPSSVASNTPPSCVMSAPSALLIQDDDCRMRLSFAHLVGSMKKLWRS